MSMFYVSNEIPCHCGARDWEYGGGQVVCRNCGSSFTSRKNKHLQEEAKQRQFRHWLEINEARLLGQREQCFDEFAREQFNLQMEQDEKRKHLEHCLGELEKALGELKKSHYL